MRLHALIAAAALSLSAAPALAQDRPAFVNVDEPVFCNAGGFADSREQPAGFELPADKGGGKLEYVDASRAQCHQVVAGKPTGQYRRPTICPLGSGRIQLDGAWVCRSQKPAGS